MEVHSQLPGLSMRKCKKHLAEDPALSEWPAIDNINANEKKKMSWNTARLIIMHARMNPSALANNM